MSSKLKSGIFWSVVEVIVKRSLDFVVKLILARLLFPEDFGIVGMATVFTSFINVINEAGMGSAIVQKQNINNKHLNTVFWTNIFWSIFLYALLSLIIAPLASIFYDQPILKKVIPVLSLSVLVNALTTVQYAYLKKELNFKRLTIVRNVSSFIAAIISVLLALTGFGIWALIANTLIAYIVSIPLYFRATKYKPKFEWDYRIFREIFMYGVYITGTRVVINLIGNADYLLIGKWVSAEAVGIYTLAIMMTNSISGQITSMIDNVMFPFYSSIQDNLDKIKSYYIKVVKVYAILLYPIMITLFLYADKIVMLVFGEKWIEVVSPLRFLSISLMISVLTTGYNILFRSIGKTNIEFRIQIITSITIYLPLLITGIYFYGIVGAALGVLFSRTLNFFVHQFILHKYFNIKLIDIFKNNSRIISISLFVIGVVYVLRYMNVNVIFEIVLFIIIFASLLLYAFRNEVNNMVLTRFKKII